MMLLPGCFCLLATLVALVLPFSTVATGEATPSSLHDVLSARDQARLRRLFLSAAPYSNMATAFHVASSLNSLGFQDSDKKVGSP